jgi:hypothetical protein
MAGYRHLLTQAFREGKTMKKRGFVYYLALGGLLATIANCAAVAMAAPPPSVPEIDPSSAASAMAVLAGSGLMLAERFGFRRK